MQDKLTAISTHLLFFGLELNRLDDAAIEEALKTPALAVYRPWIEDLRLERPYQLEDRIEQLFHEKYATGRGAWNRLFDETMATLRFDVDGEKLPLEPTLNRLVDPDETKRKAGAEALAATFKENIRLFTHVTNVLAKDKSISDEWRGFKDVAAARHLSNRVEPEVVDALVKAVHDAYPRLSHRYYALKARWLGKDKLEFWDRNAPLPESSDRRVGWEEARRTVLGAYGDFAPEMAAIAKRFFDKQLDRRADAARQGARRLRASDRALGAPLRAPELPGEDARRDDARARARPRRASGARRRPGPADVADAADARGDGERLRRDADLPRHAASGARTRASARSCSPRRSRT